MSKELTIVEIRGQKFEVDLREARKIEQFRVGDRVKVLKKKYSDWKVFHGVIIGFENFKKHPTIVIAYIEDTYNKAEIEILYFNSETDKEVEIAVARDDDKMALSKNTVLKILEDKIRVKKREIEDTEEQRNYFLAKFGCYFEDCIEDEAETA